MNAPLALITILALSFSRATTPARRPVRNEAPEAARQRLFESYGKLPLSFERNQGQAAPEVAFVAQGSGYTLLLLKSGEAVLGLRGGAKDRASVLRMKLLGAGAAAAEGREELPGRSNYFIGNDPAAWRANIPHYARVEYGQVYPGVNLVYYGNQRRLEYDFVVAPGADPGLIRLELEGARRIRVDSGGNLVVGLAESSEEIRFHKPVLYQETEGGRKSIWGRYVVRGRRQIGFAVGSYDKAWRLVVDPVLVYSTYLGGGGDDFARSIAIDSSGNAYVTGYTTSANFPTTVGPSQTKFTAAFVTKLNAAGSALLYSTYLGGAVGDNALGIAVDSSGNAYVTGITRGSFPTTVGAFQTVFGGGSVDAFVTKLNAAGSALVYSTYLGGSQFDISFGIAVDSSGGAYITGNTSSPDFPQVGAIASACVGICNSVFGSVAFVTKINAAGSALVYSTRLGGGVLDEGHAIAVDQAGNAYVTGNTSSPDFPQVGAIASACLGNCGSGFPSPDAFVTKVNAAGSALIYSTYLGGSGLDDGKGIAVDQAGNAYVTGATHSPDFPKVGAIASACAGTCGGGNSPLDAFVTKINAAGSALVYSTFLGGSGDDAGNAIAVDQFGNAYVHGNTVSADFPKVGAIASACAGTCGSGASFDAFVTKINAAGSALVYSTYLGGSAIERATGIAVDVAGNAYVTGQTGALLFAVSRLPSRDDPRLQRSGLGHETGSVWAVINDFPTTAGAFQTTYGGGDADAYVVKLSAVIGCQHHTIHGHLDTNVPNHPGNQDIHHGQHGHTVVPGQPLCGHNPIPGHHGLMPGPEESLTFTAGVNQDGSFNAQAPAARGSVLQLFGSAEGLYLDAQDSQPASGFAPPASGSLLYYTTSLPEVRIGGVPAKVLFSGLAPGLTGVWQINVAVPEEVPAGTLPVTINYEGDELKSIAVKIEKP